MPLPKLLSRYGRDQSGATAIEYGLLVAMLAAALIGIFSLGGATEALYNVLQTVSDEMGNASGGASP